MTVFWYGDDLIAKIKQAAMAGIVDGTEQVRNEAIDLVLSTPKSGRLYRRGGVVHQASAPGEPFASDTGSTLSSIDTEYNFVEMSGQVVARSVNAMRLEFGTMRMEPRPFLRPALANKFEAVIESVTMRIEAVLK